MALKTKPDVMLLLFQLFGLIDYTHRYEISPSERQIAFSSQSPESSLFFMTAFALAMFASYVLRCDLMITY